MTKRQRQKIIKEIGHCERCEHSEWMGLPIRFHLHHKDHNHENNERTNLMVVCGTCHDQLTICTETTRARMREAAKATSRKGIPLTEQHRVAISIGRKEGKPQAPCSELRKEKLKEYAKNNREELCERTRRGALTRKSNGYVHSKEVCARSWETRRRKKLEMSAAA